MPIFDYRCPDCGHTFEELVNRPDEHVACPACGTVAQKRLSAFAAPVGGSGGDACACYPTGGG